MGMCACATGMMQCSFGMAPSNFIVLPDKMILGENKPMANIMDNKQMVNIMPFGMCQSMANPAVSAATSAAMGVLTPQPCTPVITGSWIPGSPTVLIGGKPALNQSCKCMCAYAGVIQITNPGQAKTQVK